MVILAIISLTRHDVNKDAEPRFSGGSGFDSAEIPITALQAWTLTPCKTFRRFRPRTKCANSGGPGLGFKHPKRDSSNEEKIFSKYFCFQNMFHNLPANETRYVFISYLLILLNLIMPRIQRRPSQHCPRGLQSGSAWACPNRLHGQDLGKPHH